MIPNEVVAAWIVAAVTGTAGLSGLSLLDSRLQQMVWKLSLCRSITPA